MCKVSRRIICIHTSKGKSHDYRVFKDSRLPLQSSITMVLDSGYQGAQKQHAKTLLPLKKPRGGKHTQEQKSYNKSIARQRITVENVIGRIKRFKIISERYRNRRKRYGLRTTLIAAIYNFEILS